jgi:hypothetical protein
MSKARVVAARSVDIGVTDLTRALIFSTPIAPDALGLEMATGPCGPVGYRSGAECMRELGGSASFASRGTAIGLIRTSGEPAPRHQRCLIGMSNQLAWMLAALMISPHFLRSCRMISANSSGLLPTMVTPNSRVNRCIEGCCTAAAI